MEEEGGGRTTTGEEENTDREHWKQEDKGPISPCPRQMASWGIHQPPWLWFISEVTSAFVL